MKKLQCAIMQRFSCEQAKSEAQVLELKLP